MRWRCRSVKRTAAALSALFLFDLGYAGQGLFSMAVAAIGLVILAIGAIQAATQRSMPAAQSRALRASLYLALGVAAYGAATFHRATAEAHAAQVIDACRAFETRRGKLPDRLDDLVPEFLAAVPRAKFMLAYADFTYSKHEDHRHTLMYVALPPFGRRIYHFEGARWSTLD